MDKRLKATAFSCGACLSRSENKPEKCGIALIKPLAIETKLVKNHKVAFECLLINTSDADEPQTAKSIAERINEPDIKKKRFFFISSIFLFLISETINHYAQWTWY